MTTIITSGNIFENTNVVLDYLESDIVFDAPSKTKNVSWIRLEIAGEDNEEVFEDFYENFLTSLQRYCSIYFFYSESFKEQKSKIRSYVKLFYQLRKEKAIPEKDLVEKEIDLEKNQSILTGIIQVDELGTDYIIDELTSNGFKFGLVADKSSNEPKPVDLKRLGEELAKEIFKIGKSVRVNYLNLIKKILTPNSFIYSYMYDGKDDLIFTIYSGENVYLPLREKIKNSLPKGEIIKERQATTEEVDRIIDLYFRDWMPAKNQE